MKNVIIGRREVDFEKFVDAVNKSKNSREVCVKLGWNETVPTTRTAIDDKIKKLEMNVPNFRFTKKIETVSRVKKHNIQPINQAYYDEIEKKFEGKPQSWLTYKVDCGGILEFLENIDFATISIKDIEDYAGKKDSAILHIRSMMIHAVKNNVNGAVDKVNKNMLIWLIG